MVLSTDLYDYDYSVIEHRSKQIVIVDSLRRVVPQDVALDLLNSQLVRDLARVNCRV